jgi:hypothetical protein
MTSSLIFVVAPASQLPADPSSVQDLQMAQAGGPTTGFALRIFNRGAEHPDLAVLPVDGRLTGDRRRGSDGTQLLCDAVVVRIDPQHHWLGVYRNDPGEPASVQCLDRVALRDLSNATCWFYPTHDGTFLSWERGQRLSLQIGSIADCPEELSEAPYERSRLSVLWSLLADDASLTCVGLTYSGQRLDWPLQALSPEPMATWSRFCVDSQAHQHLVVEDSLTLFASAAADG